MDTSRAPVSIAEIELKRFVKDALSIRHANQCQQHDCADESHEDAPQIETCDTRFAELIEEEPADKSTDDTHNNVNQESLLPICFHDHAC